MLPVSYNSQESSAQSTTPGTLRYHKLGIDLEFPSAWPYKEDNASVMFYPREALLNNTGKPSVFVSIGFIPLPYHNLRIEDFATLGVNALNRTYHDFQLIENHSSTVSTPIDGFFFRTFNDTESADITNRTIFKELFTDVEPAYELVYTINGSKTLVVYTKINDDFAYYATYVSPVSQYAHYLSSAHKVLDSIIFNKSDFDALMTCRFFKSNPSILNNLDNFGPIGTAITLLGNAAVMSC